MNPKQFVLDFSSTGLVRHAKLYALQVAVGSALGGLAVVSADLKGVKISQNFEVLTLGLIYVSGFIAHGMGYLTERSKALNAQVEAVQNPVPATSEVAAQPAV